MGSFIVGSLCFISGFIAAAFLKARGWKIEVQKQAKDQVKELAGYKKRIELELKECNLLIEQKTKQLAEVNAGIKSLNEEG